MSIGSTIDGSRRLRLPLVAILTAVLALFGSAAIANALFTTTATATVTVAVPTPIAPRPAIVSCVNNNFGILQVRARFTWTAPAGTTAELKEYVIRAKDSAGVVTELARPLKTTTTVDFQAGVVGGLFSGLLALIAGGAQPLITINAVFGAYESPSAFTYRLSSAGLLGLTGVGCTLVPA